MAKNFEIVCPCCEAAIVVDRLSGEVLLHKAKERKAGGSFESMVAGLESQKSEMEKKFERETGRPYEAGIAMLAVPKKISQWNAKAKKSRSKKRVNAFGDSVNAWVYEKTASLLAAGKM